MSVFRKDSNGNIKKIAGHLTKLHNTRWFLCNKSIEDGIEYYDLPIDATEYFKAFNAYTIYCLGFNQPNKTDNPKLRYKTTVLDIFDFTNETGKVAINQLNGVYQMFIKDLTTDKKMYFCGNTHGDYIDLSRYLSKLEAKETYLKKSGDEMVGKLTINGGDTEDRSLDATGRINAEGGIFDDGNHVYSDINLPKAIQGYDASQVITFGEYERDLQAVNALAAWDGSKIVQTPLPTASDLDAYTKSEVDKKISAAITTALNTAV